MKSEIEQELAHILLVELLAYVTPSDLSKHCLTVHRHQFTFPVRWIQTQDVLLMEQGVERLVEIGPASTLTNMAKRTMENLYDGCDPLIKHREFLSAVKDVDKVYYRVETIDEDPKQVEIVNRVNLEIPILEVSASKFTIPVVASMREDTALTAGYVLQTMIAMKLKKTAAEIDTNSTIKQLAGGRSTMENEIVGDLLAEFKNLPDRPEEQCIQTLCEDLEIGFNRRLGPQTSSQISRLFSSRMPGGFSLDTAKEYLKTIWGLQDNRQDRVLLLACTVPPQTRLKSFESAELFFDDLVNKHALETGISIQKQNQIRSTTQSNTIDASVMIQFDQAWKASSEKKLQVYAQDLGIDLKSGEKKAAATRIALDEALGELDSLNAEHGAIYTSGIKPIVQRSKARSYQSWSHWAIQDATILFHQIMNQMVKHDERAMAARILHVSNCANGKLLRYIKRFAVAAKQSVADAPANNHTILESLSIICERALSLPPVFRSTYLDLMPVTDFNIKGEISVKEKPRVPSPNLERIFLTCDKGVTRTEHYKATSLKHPTFSVKSHSLGGWKIERHISDIYLRAIQQSRNPGISFEGKTVLLIGAGSGSIGSEILKGLLAGGAHVLCTTSNFSPMTVDSLKEIYSTHGGRGSRLVILPFNQASQQDVESLVSYIYNSDGLGWDLDMIFPFAALPETDRDIDQIDAKSELAHRAMLTNTIRLLGNVKRQKQIRGINTRPTHVILPLSSNHGTIGQDGLYAESKLALEGLLHKWHSEEWSSYLSLCGAEIGWTRGTGLMNSNDIVAQEVEKLGVRTFSREEMAANILALCAASVVQHFQEEPIVVDLSGGLDKVRKLGAELTRIRARIQESKDLLRAIHSEKEYDNRLTHGCITSDQTHEVDCTHSRTAIQTTELSTLPEIDYQTHVEPLADKLRGMVDLDRITVITGFAELGPFGSARTRMEVEFQNGFTDAGCIELAWVMGMIKRPANMNDKESWIDSETGQVIDEASVKSRYEDKILQNTGIRFVKSSTQERHKLQEIVLKTDLAPFTTTAKGATEYAQLHGHHAEIWQEGNSEDWYVLLKAGAIIMVPKATSKAADPAIGQLPTGWDPQIYGIEESIISQVDRITLYTLVATVEALLVSGIPDFYELYKHIHTSGVANCVGSGQGGMTSLRSLFRDRYADQTVQNDILQETFANTTGAWINMLLLGASGPIKTPVGACATALESLDSAVELISSGRIKLAIVGGVDDWSPEVGDEFRNMRAIVDSIAEENAGRSAAEFSRPMASTRAGFVEAQGAGIQIVTSARLALDLGLPIHGIVTFTGLASDKPGRSVPAPGKGILNFAAAAAESSPSPNPMLDISYRAKALKRRLAQIEETRRSELEHLNLEAENNCTTTYQNSRHEAITREAMNASASARREYGNIFYQADPQIAPLVGALSTWNLTPDSISVLCLHGTSTAKGDTNEAHILNTQLNHLGRDSAISAPAIAVTSKWLTGHSKGAASSWALNTALQILATGTVPRNGNLDDLAPELSDLEHITFLGGRGAGLKLANGVDVVSVSAFGFGQKGAQALIVHPRFLFASLLGGRDEFEGYWAKMKVRRRLAKRELWDGIWRGDLVGKRVRSAAVWDGKVDEEDVLLDKGWRA